RLQAWLVRITVRKCYRYQEKRRTQPAEVEIMETDQLTDDPSGEILRRLDREQMLRTGIDQLTERCQQVVRALFFEDPFPSYATIAKRLGLSPNSIGFTRDRCLERLGKLLEES